jgi:hypothetical protein
MWTNQGAASGVYPPFIEGCIENVSVSVGGVQLDSGFTNYNELFNIFRQYQMHDRHSYRRIMQLEGLQPATTAADYACAGVPFAVNSWLGPLGTIKILDTTILPPVTLHIRLASNLILARHAANVNVVPDYQWTDIKMYLDLLDIADGYYYNMVSSRLAQNQPIEIPYENYQCVTGSFGPVTSSTRWSTSTDCLEAIIATVKPTGYDDYGPNAIIGLSDYFLRGAGEGSSITTSVMSVNGLRYPAIPAVNADGEIFTNTSIYLGAAQDTVGQSDPNMTTLARWANNYFVAVQSFTYPDNDDGRRLVGLSGLGNVLQGSWDITGTGNNVLPMLWLKSRSVLRIGPSKMVEVVL